MARTVEQDRSSESKGRLHDFSPTHDKSDLVRSRSFPSSLSGFDSICLVSPEPTVRIPSFAGARGPLCRILARRGGGSRHPRKRRRPPQRPIGRRRQSRRRQGLRPVRLRVRRRRRRQRVAGAAGAGECPGHAVQRERGGVGEG